MHRLIVGAPFGNHLSWPGATSTLGTHTLRRRAGAWTRLWRLASTLRPVPGGGWVSRLRLPSPGIDTLEGRYVSDKIVSVHGFDEGEWVELVDRVHRLGALALECNLSCPNAPAVPVRDVLPAVRVALGCGMRVIAKLPPLRWMEVAEPLYDAGVRHFHAVNAMSVPAGSLSGPALKPYALWAVSELRERFGDSVELTGGGGVYRVGDVLDFLRAGADRVAVASMLFNPLNWPEVPAMIKTLEAWQWTR